MLRRGIGVRAAGVVDVDRRIRLGAEGGRACRSARSRASARGCRGASPRRRPCASAAAAATAASSTWAEAARNLGLAFMWRSFEGAGADEAEEALGGPRSLRRHDPDQVQRVSLTGLRPDPCVSAYRRVIDPPRAMRAAAPRRTRATGSGLVEERAAPRGDAPRAAPGCDRGRARRRPRGARSRPARVRHELRRARSCASIAAVWRPRMKRPGSVTTGVAGGDARRGSCCRPTSAPCRSPRRRPRARAGRSAAFMRGRNFSCAARRARRAPRARAARARRSARSRARAGAWKNTSTPSGSAASDAARRARPCRDGS